MKYLILALSLIFLFFLTLFQTSFMVHCKILGYVPNLVLVFVISWNLLEGWEKLPGIYLALAGGLFLDIFSSHIIGINVLIMFLIAVLIKVVLKRYVGFSIKI